jgi:hypothetical protein
VGAGHARASLHHGKPGGTWHRTPLMSPAIGLLADGSSFTSLRTAPGPTGRRPLWRTDRKVRGPERPPALGTGRPPQRSQGGGIGPQAEPGGHARRGSPWPEGPRAA